jgi:predicted small metal-binding protein
MKEFSCGDVVPGCTMSFRASSEAELLEAVAAHARADHGLATIPDSLVTQVRAKIHSAV